MGNDFWTKKLKVNDKIIVIYIINFELKEGLLIFIGDLKNPGGYSPRLSLLF